MSKHLSRVYILNFLSNQTLQIAKLYKISIFLNCIVTRNLTYHNDEFFNLFGEQSEGESGSFFSVSSE